MLYGVEQVVYYKAWNKSTNNWETADAGNHTLYWNKDGSAAAATNSPSEVDATNQPGRYKVTITAAEFQCLSAALDGKSSTSNVVLIFQDISVERLPNVAPGDNGGLATVDANNRIAGVQGTITTLDALDTAQDTQHASTLSKMLKYFQLLFRKDAAIATDNATELTAINANGGSGAGGYNNTTDSIEAIRDRGDSAWVTAATLGQILNIQPMIPNEPGIADTADYRIGFMLVNSLDDLPSTAEIDPGTISIDRKAPAATSWTSIVADAACSEGAGQIYYDEVFDTTTGYVEGDELRFTFKNQKITVGGNDYEISNSDGRIFYSRLGQQSLISTKLGLITSTTSLEVGNLISDGAVLVVKQGHTRSYTLTLPASEYGDLTGYTGKLGITKVTANAGTSTLELSVSVTSANTETQRFVFSWTSAQTGAFALDTGGNHPLRLLKDDFYGYTFTASTTNGAGDCPAHAEGHLSVKASDTTC